MICRDQLGFNFLANFFVLLLDIIILIFGLLEKMNWKAKGKLLFRRVMACQEASAQNCE